MRSIMSGIALTALVTMCMFACAPSWSIDSMAEAFAAQADLCVKRGEFGKAASLYLQAIEQQVKDPNDELDIAKLHNQLGRCFIKLSKIDAQRASFYAASGRSFGSDECLNQARIEIQEALRLQESRGNDSTEFLYIAESLEILAKVLFDTNQLSESEALYRRALSIRESKEGKECLSSAACYEGLGDVLSMSRLYKDAETNYKTALRIYERGGTQNSMKIAMVNHSLSIMYYRWHKLSAAGKYYDIAVAQYKAQISNQEAARLLKKLKEQDLPFLPVEVYGQAYKELKEFNEKAVRPKPTQIALIRNVIAASKRLGKFDEAKQLEEILKRLGGRS